MSITNLFTSGKVDYLMPPKGNDGDVLAVSSGQVVWAPGGGGGGAVSSVFGRTGAVVAQSGDYDISEIANAGSAASKDAGGTGAVCVTTNGFGAANKVLLSSDTAGTVANVAGGAGGEVLTIVAGVPAWAAPASAPVSSVFGRTGAVTAQIGDYAYADITGLDTAATKPAGGSGTYCATTSGFDGVNKVVLCSDTAGTLTNVPAGAVGEVLTIDAGGMPQWEPPASAPVSSVFGRTGAVVAQAGDYAYADISGLGNAATKVVSDAARSTVASVVGAFTVGSLTKANNTSGSIENGPAIGGTGSSVATTNGFGAANKVVISSDTAGTLSNVTGGSAGEVLTIVSGAPAWAAPASAPVSSVFGRTGAVVAQAGDYAYADISGLGDAATRTASDVTKARVASVDPTGLSSGLLATFKDSSGTVGPLAMSGSFNQVLRNTAGSLQWLTIGGTPGSTDAALKLTTADTTYVTSLALAPTTANEVALSSDTSGSVKYLANGSEGQSLVITSGAPAWGSSKISQIAGNTGQPAGSVIAYRSGAFAALPPDSTAASATRIGAPLRWRDNSGNGFDYSNFLGATVLPLELVAGTFTGDSISIGSPTPLLNLSMGGGGMVHLNLIGLHNLTATSTSPTTGIFLSFQRPAAATIPSQFWSSGVEFANFVAGSCVIQNYTTLGPAGTCSVFLSCTATHFTILLAPPGVTYTPGQDYGIAGLASLSASARLAYLGAYPTAAAITGNWD